MKFKVQKEMARLEAGSGIDLTPKDNMTMEDIIGIKTMKAIKANKKEMNF